MADAVSNNRSYYPALDGLRGVAIILVLFLHNFDFLNYFFFGWLGVDLFFVLSGFLITEILLKTLDQPHYIRNFYVRRILRIFPLYYFVLIVCLLILPHIKQVTVNAEYYTSNQGWLWAYLQNWLYSFKEPYGDKLLLHTWSLAVEEQFYLVWPFIILLLRKPGRLLVFVFLLLVAVAVARYAVWVYWKEDLAYSSLYTFTRIDGLCIGCMLALLMRINPGFLTNYTSIIVLLMAGINFGFYFINDQRSFTLPYLAFAGYTTFAVLFGILVYEAVRGKSKVIQFLFDNRLLKFFGRISYGLYVYHWPIYILLFPSTLSFVSKFMPGTYRIAEVTSAFIVSAIGVLVSVLSFHYFEKPFLQLKDKFQ